MGDNFLWKLDSVISFIHIHCFPWIILELREELKLEIVSRLLYSRYCIYVGLCRLCTAVRNSRLQISLSCCFWRFLTWISSKLHKERMRGNGERESGKQRGDIFGIFLNKKCCHVIKSMLTHFSIRHISTKLTVVNGETKSPFGYSWKLKTETENWKIL